LHSEEKRRDLKQMIEKAVRDVTELDGGIQDAHLNTTNDDVPESAATEGSDSSQE
jgi:hypothetical protein